MPRVGTTMATAIASDISSTQDDSVRPSRAIARAAVVIVNFNGGEHLLRCLEAVTAQRRAPDAVIVIDNASGDGSLEAARERFPSLHFIVNDRNLGFAAANNQALRHCAQQQIAFAALLNPDAFPEPEWLERLLVAAQRLPGYGSFASTLMRDGSADIVDGLGDSYHVTGIAWRRRHGAVLDPAWLRECDVFGACAAAALYDVQAVSDIGGFDEDFFCYMEDVDLAFRLQLAGRPCRYVPEAVAWHVGSATSGYRSEFSTYHGQRNLVFTFAKNMPSMLLWPLLPLHVVANVIALVVAATRGQTRTAWRAKRDAWHALRGARAKRAHIQALRTRGAVGTIWRALSKSPAPLFGTRP
jgi:GT2 family glycosyltransferase